MEHKVIDIELLDGHKRNYNTHPPEQIVKLKASLDRFQQVRSIVVAQESHGRYTILAGHGVVEAAGACGIAEISCDIVPASWDQATRDAYLVADNLHSQLAVSDDALLAELLQEQQDAGFDLASLGTDDEALRQLLEGLGDGYLGNEGENEEDDFEAEPDAEQTRVKLGDVWQLGRHTIACADSTDQKTYEKLLKNADVNFVWSDPPYGVNAVNKVGSINSGNPYPFGGLKKAGADAKKIEAGHYAPIIGDSTTETAIASYQLCVRAFPKAIQVWWGANHYSGIFPSASCWIVWDKVNEGMAFADAELAYCSHKSAVRIFKHQWQGLLKDSERNEKRVHPTQKPIALAEWAFEKYGTEDDIIFDPFLGSGISVIAAEKLPGERKVIGCELSPAYIDVCITRWEQLTGQQATLLERVEEATHA